MNKNLTLLFVAAFAIPAFAASEEKLNRQLDVHPGGKLVVDVDFGTIDVSAGADDKATIEAFRSVDFGNETKEKQYLAQVPVTISTDGNVVTVRARSANESRHLHFHFHHTSMDGRYTIRVPKNFAAELNTGGGKIFANELNGELRANSGGGELKFSHLRGAVLAETGGGSVQMDACDGATEIKSGGGDLALTNGRGVLRARTGGGVIQVRDYAGDTDVETGGGELILQKIDGRIAGETGGGAITASVSGASVKEIELESSGGSIELALPATAAVDIRADTGSGRITTDLPLEFTDEDHEHLRGKLNGGGKPVVLRTSAGSIAIKSGSSETAAR
jgi:DUF4097 and DUF4098 domain-containing protein YvlB